MTRTILSYSDVTSSIKEEEEEGYISEDKDENPLKRQYTSSDADSDDDSDDDSEEEEEEEESFHRAVLPVAKSIQNEHLGPQTGEEYLLCVQREAKSLPRVTSAAVKAQSIASCELAVPAYSRPLDRIPQGSSERAFLNWFVERRLAFRIARNEAKSNSLMHTIQDHYPQNLDENAWRLFCDADLVESDDIADILFEESDLPYKVLICLSQRVLIRLIQLHTKWLRQLDTSINFEALANAQYIKYRWIIHLLLCLDDPHEFLREEMSVLRELGRYSISCLLGPGDPGDKVKFYHKTLLYILHQIYNQTDLFIPVSE